MFRPYEARNDFWRLDFYKYFAPLGLEANCPFPKDQDHPSPALPINGIDGEGERGGGFNKVLNHFEGRR